MITYMAPSHGQGITMAPHKTTYNSQNEPMLRTKPMSRTMSSKQWSKQNLPVIQYAHRATTTTGRLKYTR